MFALLSVEAGIGEPKPLDRLPANNVRLDNFLHIRFGNVPIPDRIRIHDDVRPMLALIEAAGLIRPYFALQPTLGELLLKQFLQLGLCLRIAASPRMPRRALVSTDEDMLFEFRHQATVATRGTLAAPGCAVPVWVSPIPASQIPSKSTKYPCTSMPGIAALRLAAAICRSRS